MLIVASSVTAFATIAPVGAQEPKRGETVDQRPRPDYDSAGLRFGGFLLFPSADVMLRHDDNIYRREDETVEDFILSVRPRLRAASRWSNHELVLETGVDADFFESRHDENSTDWFATAAGRLDITRNTNVYADLRLQALHEDRGDPNAADVADVKEPVSHAHRGASLGAFHRLNRLNLTIEGGFTDLSYDDAVKADGARSRQNDRDRSEIELMARVGYEIVPEYEAFVRTTHYRRDYERRQGASPYDRDSDGWELVAGTALDLGGVVFGEVFTGYRMQGYDDSRLPAIDGPAFGGSLDWNLTPLTTISGSVQRTVEESTFTKASGFLATTTRIGVDHELLRNLILSAGFDFIHRDYEGISHKDDVAGVTIGGAWLIHRNLHVDFGYRIEERDSTNGDSDYDANIVSLSARLQY